MKIAVDPKAVSKTKWHEILIRFIFGGLVTVLAGWVAKRYGPVVGGLFLAFPGIFPASVTLVARHVQSEKEDRGEPGKIRGIKAAGVEAVGAQIGSVGLLAFAAVIW